MSTGNIPFDDDQCVERQDAGDLLKCRVNVQRLRERRYGDGPRWTVRRLAEARTV